MADSFLSEIRLFAGTYAPEGWAFCWGQLMSVSDNPALYSLLGTTYGGDGRSTFGLPDLRGRAAMGYGYGQGLSPHTLGEKWGYEYVTLQEAQLPHHTHGASMDVELTLKAQTGNGTLHEPATGSTLAAGYYDGSGGGQPEPIEIYAPSGTQATVPLGGISASPPGVEVEPSGGSGAHNNMQPSQALNYIISLYGDWPPRN